MIGDKRKIRVGMIGTKFMGKAHSNAFRGMPFFFDSDTVPVMQAIAGRDEETTKQAADKMGWASYETDWRRLIERDDIDLIDICTSNDRHAEMAIAAAQAGKHILCEKPLALNAQQTAQMLEAVRKSGVVHMICHNYRFVPAIRYAKQLIDDGVLGQIYHFRGAYLQDWIMDPQFPLVWRLSKAASGSGTHGDIMAHSIDLARYLVGEIAEVSGMMDTFIKQRPIAGDSDSGEIRLGEVDVDDAAAFLARFANGVFGVFEATRFAKGHRNSHSFEINGSKGSLRWSMDNMNDLELFLENDARGMQGFRTIGCTEHVHPHSGAFWPAGHPIGYEHTFISLVYEMMQGISANRCPAPNFEDGHRNQLVLDAVIESAEKKIWVTISG